MIHIIHFRDQSNLSCVLYSQTWRTSSRDRFGRSGSIFNRRYAWRCRCFVSKSNLEYRVPCSAIRIGNFSVRVHIMDRNRKFINCWCEHHLSKLHINQMWNWCDHMWNLGDLMWNWCDHMWNLGDLMWNSCDHMWNLCDLMWNWCDLMWNPSEIDVISFWVHEITCEILKRAEWSDARVYFLAGYLITYHFTFQW